MSDHFGNVRNNNKNEKREGGGIGEMEERVVSEPDEGGRCSRWW